MNKIDFCIVFSVNGANPNGDPLNRNSPRMDLDGFGEMSDVCLKRKMRNYLQDMGESIFVQSNDRIDDNFYSLKSRIDSLDGFKEEAKKIKPDLKFLRDICCKKYLDIRAFGQVIPIKKGSLSIRGPVTISFAKSLSEIFVEEKQITKSTNLNETKDGGKDSSTVGRKYIVRNSAYVAYGSIFPNLAQKTNFTDEDVNKIRMSLIHLFDFDASASRPSGSMILQRLYWWEHDCPLGQYSSGKVFRTLTFKPETEYPFFSVEESRLCGLTPQIYDAIEN